MVLCHLAQKLFVEHQCSAVAHVTNHNFAFHYNAWNCTCTALLWTELSLLTQGQKLLLRQVKCLFEGFLRIRVEVFCPGQECHEIIFQKFSATGPAMSIEHWVKINLFLFFRLFFQMVLEVRLLNSVLANVSVFIVLPSALLVDKIKFGLHLLWRLWNKLDTEVCLRP